MPPKRLMALPGGFPNNTPSPRFQLGDRVLLTPDFGTVTGMEYAPSKHLKGWGWRYIILFDRQSPSCGWIGSDLAWEDDLRILVPALVGRDMEQQPT